MSEAPSARHPRTLPPIPAVLLAVVSVQGGAAFAKELFPVLGSAGTAGMRIGLSALLLLAVFRPPLARLTRAQWAAVIPYGVVLGTMNLSFYRCQPGADFARRALARAVAHDLPTPPSRGGSGRC